MSHLLRPGPVVLVTLAIVLVVLILGLEYRVQAGHFEPGFGRIGTYTVTDDPRRIVVHYTSGYGDQVIGPEVVEDDKSVTVAMRISVWVPGRNTFKQLSATLLQETLALRSPLGDRTVVDRQTGTRVPRNPTQ